MAKIAIDEQRPHLLESAEIWESMANALDGDAPSGAPVQPPGTKAQKPVG